MRLQCNEASLLALPLVLQGPVVMQPDFHPMSLHSEAAEGGRLLGRALDDRQNFFEALVLVRLGGGVHRLHDTRRRPLILVRVPSSHERQLV